MSSIFDNSIGSPSAMIADSRCEANDDDYDCREDNDTDNTCYLSTNPKVLAMRRHQPIKVLYGLSFEGSSG